MIGNGQLEKIILTVEQNFEVAEFNYCERFTTLKTLDHPLIGIMPPSTKYCILKAKQRFLTLLYLSKQLNHENTRNIRVPPAPTVNRAPINTGSKGTLAIIFKVSNLLDNDCTCIFASLVN